MLTMHLPTARCIEVMVKALATVILLAAMLASAAADRATARPDTQLHAVLARLAATAHAPGGVLLLSDPGGVRRATIGVSNRRTREPMRSDRRFRVASITKMFVATTVLQLVGEGKLRLDDRLSSVLPGAVVGGDRVTIRRLLNHTSGIYAGAPLDAEPGPFVYDNENYRLLGRVVATVTGKSVRRELAERIIAPLRLRGTTWPRRRLPVRLAHGYSPRGVDVGARAPGSLDAADALVSTAGDLHRFLVALLRGRLLAPKQLREMETSLRVGSYYRPVDDRYGLGLMGFDTRCGRVWGHRGRIAGYTSFVFGTPDASRTIVVLLNVGRVDDATAVRLNRLMFAALCA
jgi:D-alanyl-D-alanine carboxypeptidase